MTNASFKHIELQADERLKSLRVLLQPQAGKPLNNSPELIQELRVLMQRLRPAPGHMLWEGKTPVHYLVLQSAHPTYFNLGGDLSHFLRCIEQRDEQSLLDYSLLSLELVMDWASNWQERVTSVALVQGRALGGGFEMALSCDYIIAEEQSEFSLPEIVFGLFPTSGAIPLLARRVHLREARRMAETGRVYTAAELFEMGVVDEVCARGEGPQCVQTFLQAHARRRKSRMALQQSANRLLPLSRQEIEANVRDWVHNAMQLTAQERRTLETLVKLQHSGMAH